MIALIGDVHGELAVLERRVKEAMALGATIAIQVGDLGFYPGVYSHYECVGLDLPIPVYAIDGNHENYNLIRLLVQRANGRPVEWLPNLFYVPRGSVLKLDGRTIGFLGGAGSIDRKWRTEGVDWFPQEQITSMDCQRLLDAATGRSLDLLITHCPPQSVIDRHFEQDPYAKVRAFDVPVDWRDPSAAKVELLHMGLGYPPLYCGHMHRSVSDGKVRILDCDELVLV